MGLLSFVRNRKQVVASRAGQGAAKLSAGNFSHFGGNNGASVSMWDAEPGQRVGPQPATRGDLQSKSKREAGAPNFHPVNPEDSWGTTRSDAFTNVSGKKSRRSSLDSSSPETAEQETARGARMKVSNNVSILGPKVGGKPDAKGNATGDRWKIDGETRGRVRAIKEQNSAQGRSDDLPTTKDVDKENNKNKMTKPTPGKKAWDD